MSRDPISPMAELEVLGTHCQHLRLTRVAQTLPTLLEQAAQRELSYSAFLQSVLETEVAAKMETHQTMRVQTARSRTCGENRVPLAMTPSSHEMEPPGIPGRFRLTRAEAERLLERLVAQQLR